MLKNKKTLDILKIDYYYDITKGGDILILRINSNGNSKIY